MKRRNALLVAPLIIGLAAFAWYLQSRLPQPIEFVFEQPETLQLVSLDPEKYVERFRDPNDPRVWKELGVLDAKTPEQQKRIIAAFRDSVGKAEPVRCFWPRHAIRASREGTQVDIVICFQCNHAQIYVNNKRLSEDIPVSDEGAKALNRILIDAHIPLANSE